MWKYSSSWNISESVLGNFGDSTDDVWHCACWKDEDQSSCYSSPDFWPCGTCKGIIVGISFLFPPVVQMIPSQFQCLLEEYGFYFPQGQYVIQLWSVEWQDNSCNVHTLYCILLIYLFICLLAWNGGSYSPHYIIQKYGCSYLKG